MGPEFDPAIELGPVVLTRLRRRPSRVPRHKSAGFPVLASEAARRPLGEIALAEWIAQQKE
ncbi:hypothetical protein [Pseudonocardia adelaidensis]|uniref:Uncharacterized protein n=1 Tax=Pseudonocardia adelaidensis TaxID=648754 RepID=A0ABP9NDS6_9PSEU